jgi:hypothetical protein
MINAVPEEDFHCTNKARSLNGTVCPQCDPEADPLTRLIAQEEGLLAISKSAIPVSYTPDKNSTSQFHLLLKKFSGRENDLFPSDTGNPCQCPHSHSVHCPLNMETRGELGAKRQITRGSVSPMCAQC